MSQSSGIHHITAVAGDPVHNYEFYSGVLGLRLVKKTVNYDDPTTYHLYYGNGAGDPGTILTFFPWRHLKNGKPDRGQVVAVALSVAAESKVFWQQHLKGKGIDTTEIFERFGKQIIGLQDPDGLHLELVFDPAVNGTGGWEGGPVPGRHTVRGIYGATLAEKEYAPTARLLENDLGFELTDQSDSRYCFRSEGDFGSVIEVIDQFGPHGRSGRGTVHHIAFRAEDEEEQLEKSGKLFDKGYHLTEVKDRTYFKSVYFHEPGGILFEIATDLPGFTQDEPIESLGAELKLPPWLESQRHRIEAELPQLTD